MKICPKCKKKWPVDGKFCPMDGTTLVEEEEKKKKIARSEKKTVEDFPLEERKKWFSETKWFMAGDKIKDEDVTPEDIPIDDLDKIYRKTSELPPDIRKKYSLSFDDEKKEKKNKK